MPALYILRLCDGNYYIGSTDNLARRVAEHQSGRSPYTSHFLPISLIFHQDYDTLLEARRAEYWLKRQKDKAFLGRIIREGKLLKAFR